MTPTAPDIVVTRRPPGDVLARLADAGTLYVWEDDRPMPPELLRQQLAAASGLYCMLTDPIDAALLDAAPSLRVVSTMAVGVDNIDLAACTARRIPVGHTPGVLTETTADLAFALLLAAARRIVEGVDYVRAGRWQRWEPDALPGHDVHGTVLGIIGLGRIGRAVARRAAGFGMTVWYHSRSPHPDVESDLGVVRKSLDTLLAGSDHVVVTVALTDETRHIIDADALATMKPTATLVNVSRGGTVDQEALRVALERGEIAAAGLDVTDPEPIDHRDPLLRLPNCVVIPHIGSSSWATRVAMADLAGANLLAGLAGEQLPACANPEVYG